MGVLRYLLPIVLAGLFGASDVLAAESGPPEIIAQGFDLALPRQGPLGKFGRLRVRIQAPARISTLLVRERSYEVDLATTLDQGNYHLFGIKKRVRRYKDVTLDFHNYINEKIKAAGSYEFLIRVKDDKGGAATVHLAIIVTAEDTLKKRQTDVDIPPMKTGRFRLERAGPGPVKGGATFGLTWKTVDVAQVVIRINVTEKGSSITDGLTISQYGKIFGTPDLDFRQNIERDGASDYIEVPTARNAAAGRVLAIDTPRRYCVMRFDQSETSLSRIGTTIVVQGEYKCSET